VKKLLKFSILIIFIVVILQSKSYAPIRVIVDGDYCVAKKSSKWMGHIVTAINTNSICSGYIVNKDRDISFFYFLKSFDTETGVFHVPKKLISSYLISFQKKEPFDTDKVQALIDKSKVDIDEISSKNNDNQTSSGITNYFSKSLINTQLTLKDIQKLQAGIYNCWSIPLGLPFNEDLKVRIKVKLAPNGSVTNIEILDYARMNKPGQGFYKVLVESAVRAIKLCSPLKVPSTGYENWKEMILNFDAKKMLEG